MLCASNSPRRLLSPAFVVILGTVLLVSCQSKQTKRQPASAKATQLASEPERPKKQPPVAKPQPTKSPSNAGGSKPSQQHLDLPVAPAPEAPSPSVTPLPSAIAVEPVPVLLPAKTEPTSVPTAPITSGQLTVKRLTLAEDVADREPVNPGSTFNTGTKIYLFLEVANESEAEQSLVVQWERNDGRKRPPTNLTIPVRKRHRTRAYSPKFKKPGAYSCTVTREDGSILKRLEFTVVERAKPTTDI